jgi:hypothetical protein
MFGLSAVQTIVPQHVPGYPNTSQVIWYIGLPFGILAALVASSFLCNASRAPPWVLGSVSAVSLIAVLPWLMVAGGGI